MATSPRQKLQLILVVLSLFVISATNSSAPSFPPSAHEPDHSRIYPSTLFATILASLGFQEHSSAAVDANLSTPITIFAPSDSSLLTCPSCSLPLLLQEHAIPGLYSIEYLRKLAFGTKFETLATDHCLTITTSTSAAQNDSSKIIFVNGVELSHPNLFYNGVVMIHGLQGFVTHLSPLSCDVERQTSLSFPQPWQFKAPTSPMMRLMLKDAIIRLRLGGYSIVSLALKVKLAELCELRAMTVFALDDVSIFSGSGHAYLYHFRFHVVPNRRLMAADLVSLQPATVLPTMEIEQNLVVTTPGGGGPLAPMKINYVKVTTMDLLHNSRIAVHAVSTAFPHMHHHLSGKDNSAEEEYYHYFEQMGGSASAAPSMCDLSSSVGMCEVEASAPGGIRSMVDVFQMDDSGLLLEDSGGL